MNVTVYCGASTGNSSVYSEAAQDLGEWIAKRGHTLVYGGGRAGLMGIVADTVLDAGSTVTGVMPTFLQERELAHKNLSEIIIVDSMSERKAKMIELGDCYIALPGGPGTLEEISEVISWSRIGQNNNPCILMNTNGYYDSLKRFYDDMVRNGFLSESDRKCFLFADTTDDIDSFIDQYQPPAIRKYT